MRTQNKPTKGDETISMRTYPSDKKFLMRMRSRYGYNSLATTLNKILKIVKDNKMENELQ